MVCLCAACQQLRTRTLGEIPLVRESPQAQQLLAHVIQRWFFAILEGSQCLEFCGSPWPALPDHYSDHDGDGHHQVLRALCHGEPACDWLIYECSPPIYVWRWDEAARPSLLRKLFMEALTFAVIPSGMSVVEVVKRDQAKRRDLDALHRSRHSHPDAQEIGLMRFLVQGDHGPHSSARPDLHTLCPYLFDFRSEITPGRSDQGECDLVFTDAHQRVWCVVEVKHMDVSSHGKTARSRRTSKRSQVREQAINNRKRLFDRLKSPEPNQSRSTGGNGTDAPVPSMLLVLAATLTNENVEPQWVTEADALAVRALLDVSASASRRINPAQRALLPSSSDAPAGQAALLLGAGLFLGGCLLRLASAPGDKSPSAPELRQRRMPQHSPPAAAHARAFSSAEQKYAPRSDRANQSESSPHPSQLETLNRRQSELTAVESRPSEARFHLPAALDRCPVPVQQRHPSRCTVTAADSAAAPWV